MEKKDLKKELKHLYRPAQDTVSFVDVPTMHFLKIDGQGDPGTSAEYPDAMQALYPVAYALKFMVKKSDLAIDYGVMPLEGLWWADDMSAFREGRRDEWKWTSLIMQPHWITKAMVEEAVADVRAKKNPAALSKIRFDSYHEGKAAQLMHVGPFSEEGPAIEGIHNAITDSGHRINGPHHEIYLSDMRRADPSKWKTIIRQPYK